MTIVIPHQTTAEKAISIVADSGHSLFDAAAGPRVQLTDRKRTWNGPEMDFSATARVGFIAIPLAGKLMVDDTNVTVHFELPALVRQFVGEDRIRTGLDRRIRGLLTPES
jgi:hypothetical protein